MELPKKRDPMTPASQCGATTRAGTPCKHEAGWGTDHFGEGRCKLHGGATPIRHGRYSKVNRARLASLIDEMADDPDPLDVGPELATGRALLLELLETAVNTENRQEAIKQAATVAGIAQKEKRLRISNAISRPDLYRVLTEIVRIAEDHPDISTDTLEELKDGWQKIRI